MIDKLLVKEIIAPIVIILFFTLLYNIIKKILKKAIYLKMTKIDIKRQKTIISLILNIIKYFFIIISLMMILAVYGINTSVLVTSLGAVGVVVGLAFQDIIKDLISGIFIIIENQYGIGDIVSISGFKGEVIALGLKSTKLKSATGEVNIISNRNVDGVINYSQFPSLAILDITVSYEDDLNKVEKVMSNLFKELEQKIDNLKGQITILGVNSLDESGIVYRVQVETEPMKQFEVQRKILKAVKLEFDKNKITIPYNQVVIHNA